MGSAGFAYSGELDSRNERMMNSNQKRALYVMGQPCSSSAKKAGHKTAFTNLARLAKDYLVDVVVLCGEGEVEELKIEPVPVGSVDVMPVSKFGKILAVVRGAAFGLPPRFATRYSWTAERRLRKRLMEGQYDLVWLEFHQVYWVSELVPSIGQRRETVVLSSHDIVSQVVARKDWREQVFMLGWTYRYEKQLFRRADVVGVPSEKDLELVRIFFDVSTGKLLPPPLSGFVYAVKRSEENIKPYSLLFWGAMDRGENHDAIIWFIDMVMPGLIRRFPDLKLYVVGANPRNALKALSSDSIVVTGYIEDPSEYFESCSLGIVPLIEGAGIKVKTLEMLQAGIPVVSTPVGAEGIPRSDLLTISDGNGFGDQITGRWLARLGR